MPPRWVASRKLSVSALGFNSEVRVAEEGKQHYFPAEYAIEVYRTEKDFVAIRQENVLGDEDDVVLLSPERVDRLILMLRAVKDEILTDRADAAEARSTHPPPLSNG